MKTHHGSCPFFKIKFKDFSRAFKDHPKHIQGDYINQNGTFISISKRVQSKFEILTLSSINKNWSHQKYLPNA